MRFTGQTLIGGRQKVVGPWKFSGRATGEIEPSARCGV